MTFKTSSKRAAEIEAAAQGEEHLVEGITHPGLHDCLCGRGGHATNHPGNVHFRTLVSKYKDYYMGLSRHGKLQVAAEVVKLWRTQHPPGRFLAMIDPSRREETTWYDVGDKEALKKTSQCLRERIPPHQKARTLEMVSKKARASKAKQNTATDNSAKAQSVARDAAPRSPAQPESRHDSSHQPGVDSSWGKIQHEMMMDQDWQPRPILEPATVSVASSPTSPHKSSSEQKVNQIAVSGAPPLPASRDHLIGMDSSQIPEPTPLRYLQRDSSWTPNMDSIANSNEEFSMMNEFLNDELRTIAMNNAQNVSYSETSAQSNDDQVDGSLIPSAANLTKDVFDDNIYKPLIYGKTNVFGGKDVPDLASYAPQQPTLNQTLSAGWGNTFSSL